MYKEHGMLSSINVTEHTKCVIRTHINDAYSKEWGYLFSMHLCYYCILDKQFLEQNTYNTLGKNLFDVIGIF